MLSIPQTSCGVQAAPTLPSPWDRETLPTALLALPPAPPEHAPSTILLSVNRLHRGKLARTDPLWSDTEGGGYNGGFVAELVTPVERAVLISEGYACAPALHGSRCTANFASAQSIELDVDVSWAARALLTHPLVNAFATIVHDTASSLLGAERRRAIFHLDRPIVDPMLMRRARTTLNRLCPFADQLLVDPARLVYGAPGCQPLVRPLRYLPLDFLLALIAQENPGGDDGWHPRLSRAETTATALLNDAIAAACPGTRHQIGFELSCSLRDSGVSEADAKPLLHTYQVAVERVGDHPYSETEMLATLVAVYRRRAHRVDAEFQREVEDLRTIGLAYLRTHHDLQMRRTQGVFNEVMNVARKVGRFHDLTLPVRGIAPNIAANVTVARRLARLCRADGLLCRTARDEVFRTHRYALRKVSFNSVLEREHSPLVDNTCSPPPPPSYCSQVESADDYARIFNALGTLPMFRHGARIDPARWPGCAPRGTFGPQVQTLLAVLASHPVRSLDEWFRQSGVPWGTGKRKADLLAALGVIERLPDPSGRNRVVPVLTSDWRERLHSITPALTTFGKAEREVLRVQQDRIRHATYLITIARKDNHFGILRYRQRAEQLAAKAAQRVAEIDAEEMQAVQRAKHQP